jgi:hypothetical protein
MKTPLKPTPERTSSRDEARPLKARPGTALVNSVPPPSDWPTQKRVNELAGLLDAMSLDARAIMKLSGQLELALNYLTRKRIIHEAEKVIGHFAIWSGRKTVSDGALEKTNDKCCWPESWWPEDSDGPVYGEVAKMVALLIGSFTAGKPEAPEIFVRCLIEDIVELRPTFAELQSSWQQLRQEEDYVPSIKKVIAALKQQQKLWSRRMDVVICLREFHQGLCDEIASFNAEDHTEEERKAKLEEAARKANIRPISPDRTQ